MDGDKHAKSRSLRLWKHESSAFEGREQGRVKQGSGAGHRPLLVRHCRSGSRLNEAMFLIW
jgi:hypothetical protein